ncbi:MAG TPA: HDOD domain-containing protein [Caldithrix abyssi]|uniref:HDOD domain-containing protein n=1 Tax=Caldithrix abyssi TaxID=187145 RepID=A0A7V1LZN4_CALAY|nr:HDOD domain-containing protein [Caldithrix abyssi]
METAVQTDRPTERIERIISAINDSDISSIKSVVGSIIRLINDPKSTAKDLKEIISIDPPLTAKILRVSNSSFYAAQTQIDDVGKAIVWVGFNTVRELALRQKACELFDKDEAIEGYRRSELWAYSVATAHFAKMIYRREFGKQGDSIYSAGLLHKIGLIAEEQFLRKAFTKVLHIANVQGHHLTKIERKVFGFDHALLGKEIALNWHLPDEIVNCIAYHANPFEAPEEYFEMAAIMYISAIQCHFAQIGYYRATLFDDDLYTRCLDALGLEQDALNLIIQEGQLEIAEMLEKGAL